MISLDKDAQVPASADIVKNNGWLEAEASGWMSGAAGCADWPRALGGLPGKKQNNGQKEGSSNGRQNLLQGTGKGH